MIILNQSIKTMQNYVIWIQIALSLILKLKMFARTLQMILKKRFHISKYGISRPLPKGKDKKVIGLMKDELGENIITEFVARRSKTYPYLMDDGNTEKKVKGTKNCVIKIILKFHDYKNCLMNKKIVLKSQQRFKSEAHF